MPKIICTSRYIKNPKTSKAGGYLHYIGTREGVEKLTNGYDHKPATKKQISLICDMLKSYPPIWNYPEFEKYMSEESKGAATELINAAIKRNPEQIKDVKS